MTRSLVACSVVVWVLAPVGTARAEPRAVVRPIPAATVRALLPPRIHPALAVVVRPPAPAALRDPDPCAVPPPVAPPVAPPPRIVSVERRETLSTRTSWISAPPDEVLLAPGAVRGPGTDLPPRPLAVPRGPLGTFPVPVSSGSAILIGWRFPDEGFGSRSDGNDFLDPASGPYLGYSLTF